MPILRPRKSRAMQHGLERLHTAMAKKLRCANASRAVRYHCQSSIIVHLAEKARAKAKFIKGWPAGRYRYELRAELRLFQQRGLGRQVRRIQFSILRTLTRRWHAAGASGVTLEPPVRLRQRRRIVRKRGLHVSAHQIFCFPTNSGVMPT